MAWVTALSAVPFLLHIGTAAVIISGLDFSTIQRGSPSLLLDSMVEIYRLGPRTEAVASYIAYIQLALACTAMAFHFLGQLPWRKYGYGILLCMYAVTQLRHLVFNEGKNVIGYLYLNIAMYTILVLYNDYLYNKKLSKH